MRIFLRTSGLSGFAQSPRKRPFKSKHFALIWLSDPKIFTISVNTKNLFFQAQSLNYGCIVQDKSDGFMLHYVEKPQSYISPIINCGVYLFSLDIFDQLATVFKAKQSENSDQMWLEKDILMPLAGTKQVKVFVTTNWWSQIKTAAAAIYANRNYLKLYPQRLSHSEQIIGDVYIHPSANISPTAVIGPNVSIGKNVQVGPGAREAFINHVTERNG